MNAHRCSRFFCSWTVVVMVVRQNRRFEADLHVVVGVNGLPSRLGVTFEAESHRAVSLLCEPTRNLTKVHLLHKELCRLAPLIGDADQHVAGLHQPVR